MISRSQLLDALVAEGTLDATAPAAILQGARMDDEPGYLRALTFIGAWIASIFLLGFMAIITAGKPEAVTMLGVMILVGVVVTQKLQQGLFLRQVALASAACAQLLIIFGQLDRHADLTGALVASTVVSTLLCIFSRDPQQRFLNPLITVAVGLLSAAWDKNHGGLFDVMLAVEMVLFTAAWSLPRWRTELRPLGASMIIAAAVTLTTMQYWVPLVSAKAVVIAAALWLVVRVTGGRPSVPTLLGIIGVGIVTAPGVLFALVLMGLGLARSDRALTGVGAVFLALFISYFYYMLEVDLAAKSAILVASGLAVLGARWMMASGHLTMTEPPARSAVGGGLFLAASVGVVAFLNVAVWQKSHLVAEGRAVLLALAPVDPRSLMQGDYMRLSYALERDLNNHPGLPPSGRLVVKLDERGVATLARIGDQAEAPNEQVLRYQGGAWHWHVGPSGWYFQEGQADLYRDARYGELRCDAFGNCVLVGLRDSRLRPIIVP